jgi:hypothetical protein
MRQPARLITPQGKTIELPPEVYRQVQRLLASRQQHKTRAQMDRAIRSTYGKYAGRKSLTRALLTERAAERARENAKTIRHHG